MRPFRRRPTSPDEKPYLVTIHAPGDQHHTFRMGPGDGVGFGDLRVDVDIDGVIHASPVEPNPHLENVVDGAQHELRAVPD